jgi:hypothetical protein
MCRELSQDLNLNGGSNQDFENRFPPYNCNNNLAVSPYYIEPAWTKPAPNMTCFTVRTKTPTAVSPCNDMDFFKFELEVCEYLPSCPTPRLAPLLFTCLATYCTSI